MYCRIPFPSEAVDRTANREYLDHFARLWLCFSTSERRQTYRSGSTFGQAEPELLVENIFQRINTLALAVVQKTAQSTLWSRNKISPSPSKTGSSILCFRSSGSGMALDSSSYLSSAAASFMCGCASCYKCSTFVRLEKANNFSRSLTCDACGAVNSPCTTKGLLKDDARQDIRSR